MTKNISLEIRRIFDAPIELVFSCWSDGEKMKHWSCPQGFEITYGESNFVEGGKYRSTMKSPDYEGTVAGEYKVIDQPNKIIMTHGWEDENEKVQVSTLVTIEFIDLDGKTEMIFSQSGFDSVESEDGHRDGWNSSFENLDNYLQEN